MHDPMMEIVWEEAYNLLCGERIGGGAHRDVYECRIRKDLVVKVESGDYRYFANIFEQKFWADNQYDESVKKWLAPTEYLSPDGRILLQKKCDPLPSDYKLPEKLPAFLTDFKRKNFGLLNGKFVCLDYGITISNPSTRMIKAEFE